MNASSPPPYPDFESADFLTDHIETILAFYEPNVFDANGGFFQHFLDDGSIYDAEIRHLVSSTRFVFNYVNAWQLTGRAHYRDWAAHGLAYLESHHRHPNGHFLWQRNGERIDDGRAMAYGHAFVMLAASWALQAKIDGADDMLKNAWNLLEDYFWDAEHLAYADERDDSLAVLSDYRGQNANMHTVEALIAAYEATGDKRYLDRADQTAHQFCVVFAAAADGQIWEHYNTQWQQDWTYNIDKPDDLFKPWGFQPGHQVEWTKLLLQLDQHCPADWHLPVAQRLFDTAMEKGWDAEFGGLVYGYAPDGEFADAHKYFWVQAEAIAAARRLYAVTGEAKYREDYIRLWQWSWDHLIDHKHGAWFRIVSREGDWIEPYKSPAGKVDYHTIGACIDVLNTLKTEG